MQVIEREMVDQYAIPLDQTLDRAGQALAQVAQGLLDGDVTNRPIVVLAGRGNNGGGGLAAARYLLEWGAWVQVVCTYPPDEVEGAPAHQLQLLQEMGVPLAWAEGGWELPPSDLLVDAVIGYGLRGDPRGPAREVIQLANSSAAPVLSLDAPSGIDTEGGQVYLPHLQAAATLTLALPKTGLLADAARAACGDLYLADIGVPAALYAQLGLDVPRIFAHDAVVRWEVAQGHAVLLD
jgi:NAD(P)H-hydrate epimerase